MRISDWSSDVCSSDLAIADYFQNREKAMSAESGSYRPLPPALLYLDKDRWSAVIEEQPVHLATGFHEPESDRVIDCGVDAPRECTPERTAQANVSEAVAAHIAALTKAQTRGVLGRS